MNAQKLYNELYEAIFDLNETRARELIAQGVDINAGGMGFSLLYAIADEGCDEAVRLCLQLGGDPRTEEEGGDGYTMVYYLILGCRVGLLCELIDRGIITVDEPNSRGTTPLMWCCGATFCEEMTQALLAREADVHRTDKDGVNAFGYALNPYECPCEHFPLLLNAGADINSRDEEGRTAVMVYALGENEDPNYIRFFLEHGADVNLRSPEGKTALDYAYDNLARNRSGEHTGMNEARILEMIDLLKSYGAATSPTSEGA